MVCFRVGWGVEESLVISWGSYLMAVILVMVHWLCGREVDWDRLRLLFILRND